MDGIDGRVRGAVDLWLRWLPRWQIGTARPRTRICRKCTGSPIAAAAAKEAVLKAQDVDLDTGLSYERKLFWGLFATDDQKEGMKAFVEKRKPAFKGK